MLTAINTLRRSASLSLQAGIRSLASVLAGTPDHAGSPRPARRRLLLESLENRSLMAQLTFGTPISLGSGVNTADYESSPTTTADGLTLLFRHNQGPPDATEILEATRSSTSVPFGNVVSAGADVNNGGYPAHPEVSPDGLTLLFSKDDKSGMYQATRASRSQPFGSIVSLGDLLPGQHTHQPSLSADGLTLFFTAWDTADIQNDLYQATRPSASEPWGNVVMLSSAINVPGYNDAMPSISPDGLALFFNSNRPGGFGDFDLYVATRPSLQSPWQPAINLGSQVNTAYNDKGPSISVDGGLLYFHSNRPGGAGDEDLYQVAVGYANDTKFFVVNDATANQTFEYDSNGGGIENYALNASNVTPRGAASTAAGDKVWVVDVNRKVYVYGPSGNLLGSWSAGSLASNADVQGIATNGTDIWIVDAKQDKVFKYTGAASKLAGSQNAASSFNLNGSNTSPTDLVTDGTSIWVLNNSSTDKVFKYTVGGSLLGSWTITSGGTSPTGITIDPSNATQDMWIVDSASDKVYRLAGARTTTTTSVAATSPFSLAAGNTNPQGIADPPNVGRLEPERPALGTTPASPTVSSRDAALLSLLHDLDNLLLGAKKRVAQPAHPSPALHIPSARFVRPSIQGDSGDDILVAGFTSFADEGAALMAIQSEWTSSHTYAQRTAILAASHLKVSGPAATVYDDNEKDTLAGDAGRDWFFANVVLDPHDDANKKDKITDLAANEFAADLDFILGNG